MNGLSLHHIAGNHADDKHQSPARNYAKRVEDVSNRNMQVELGEGGVEGMEHASDLRTLKIGLLGMDSGDFRGGDGGVIEMYDVDGCGRLALICSRNWKLNIPDAWGSSHPGTA